WASNEEKYPILSVIARRYLAIPATIAAIEGNFNTSGNIISKRRTSLKASTRKELVLLKNW
ncbi:hypothetical protein ACRALDRAFT_2074261, partial [Sodiomyces alcalophilus JCM 7366]|uniref:uncharacterized protein n=1 Tax=Sodiomyces alcalophilus JCM 7366 TaxID=591952 RepID=UPI0039B5388A